MHFFASLAIFFFFFLDFFFFFFGLTCMSDAFFEFFFGWYRGNGKGRFGPEFRKALWSLCSTLGLFTKNPPKKSQAHKRRSFNLGVGDLSSEKESRQRATFDQNENKMYAMFIVCKLIRQFCFIRKMICFPFKMVLNT